MEDLLRSGALGIVQGLSEFLPISSSGHLIVARDLFNWEFSDDLTFDVALSLGTALALVAFFWREWFRMLRGGLLWAANGGRNPQADRVYDGRLLFLLMLGSILAAAVGLVLDRYVEETLRSPLVVGAMLVSFGVVLFAAESLGSRHRGVADCGRRDALWIGAAAAAVGWLAIRYLLKLVQSGSYLPFVAYRVLVGVFVLVYFAV